LLKKRFMPKISLVSATAFGQRSCCDHVLRPDSLTDRIGHSLLLPAVPASNRTAIVLRLHARVAGVHTILARPPRLAHERARHRL